MMFYSWQKIHNIKQPVTFYVQENLANKRQNIGIKNPADLSLRDPGAFTYLEYLLIEEKPG
jgi:hypothetical protein